jgi:dihydroflavonol-4-reductase
MIENEKANHGLESLPLEKIICDIRDPLQVHGCLRGMDVVIHAAADTSVWPTHSEKVYDINVRGTENLIEEAILSKVKRFIYVGSACAFGWGSMQSPGTENTAYWRFNYRIEYYETKLLAQQAILKAVRERNLPAIVVNPTFMVGPYDYKMNAARLVSSIIKRKFPGYPPGGRNFVHAKDVAAAICRAIQSGSIGECYILGNENLSYRDFFKTVAEVSGQKIPLLPIPAFLVCLTGMIQSLFAMLSGIPPKLGFNMARGACQNAFYSSEKAIEHLQLSRTPISVAIHETIEWLHDHKTRNDG